MPPLKAAPTSARKSTGRANARGKSPGARKSLSVFDPEVDPVERETWVSAHCGSRVHSHLAPESSLRPTRTFTPHCG